MFICVGDNESFSFAKNVGIGLIESAIGTTKICLQHTPKRLIFIGSAGSYDSDISIGEIFYSFCATQIELSFLEGKSYTPIENSIQMESFKIVSHETKNTHTVNTLGVLQAIVNSSNYITKTSEFNQLMLRANIQLENMEFFSVLKVAQYFEIPCFGIFCVSNFVHENSHEEFLQNHHSVKKKLKHFVQNTFEV
ncbi:purine-nucleoside phosphorylase [Helicobacter didelphidarum]|uniref:Purine-nucleoside phosphorylase n=1 Tax=Helicobacter didelphidarum TaxID=2040648 RepID=A0A3D8IBX3_9HELI|nr:purine-nucleoside phosphorylase [Helicobacter didelphidarum]RDU62608.1 purine-nucleoside phosphorylase [Helicobacter didelphidarum]